MWQDNEGYWHNSEADMKAANAYKLSTLKFNPATGSGTINIQKLPNNSVDGPISQEAMRFDDNKIRFDLVPPEAELELARVYTMGAIKYADDNWRKGMSWRKCVGALKRHLNLWLSGQSIDPETGCHHLSQVAWNALTLMVYEMSGAGKDDRVKFDVDEKFNWKNNHLGIGLSDDKITALKNKYKEKK